MSAIRAFRWIGILAAVAALLFFSAWLSPPAATLQARLVSQAGLEPGGVSFTVPGSDPLTSLGVEPADILGVGSVPLILCDDVGLTCADSGAGDAIEGLAYGSDFRSTDAMPIQFGVSAASRGITGTAVRAEADCTPPEARADVFGSALDRSNVQVWDGDGNACGGNSGLPLFLTEGAASSRVNALDGAACPNVDWNCDGIPDAPVMVTLASGSPTLAGIGATPADILILHTSVEPVKWADGVTDLGLMAGDRIDALCVNENGNGVYDGEDQVLFSLAPGSPSLAARSASAADLWLPGHAAVPFYRASSLGLQATDDVTTLMCSFELSLSHIYLPVVFRQASN